MSDGMHTEIVEYREHKYHLVNPSPWPIVGAFSALSMFLGTAFLLHGKHIGYVFAPAGLIMILVTMYMWWKDVVNEGRHEKAHTPIVRTGLRIGMGLFILSEVMFFFAFFWSFFKSSMGPMMLLDGIWPTTPGVWPPADIKTFDPWHIPFMNTLILLLSGTTVTWAHHALLEGNKKELVRALGITILLGLSFTGFQAYEYIHAPFAFKGGIYPSNFYMATGFHGFHVIIGTIFLAVCYFRAKKDHFSKEHHLGFEFAAWYWHFVDVVWLFLFACVYIWGS